MSWFVNSDEAIATDRLILEPLTDDHADEMVAVLADPDLYTVIGGTPPTLQRLRERYRQLAVGRSDDGTQQWLNWIVRVRDDHGAPGGAVGTVQATVMAEGARAEVAWIIGTPWQGQGIGSEAARALVDWLSRSGIRYLTAHVHPGHPASQAVARRAGLVATDDYDDGEQRWILGAPPDTAG